MVVARRNPTRRPLKVRADQRRQRWTVALALASAARLLISSSAWTSVRQERWEGDLAVEGTLPAWLNGTYLRNGPGLWDVGDHVFHHLFDGYATLVRVSFRHGRAMGAHRHIESDAYTSARANGRPVLREFSQCPANNSLLDRVSNVVGTLTGAALTDNPNSAVLPLGDDRVLCLTETTKSSVLIDPDMLDTVGKFRYADKLADDKHDDELLTVLPDLMVPRPGYLVVRMASGARIWDSARKA